MAVAAVCHDNCRVGICDDAVHHPYCGERPRLSAVPMSILCPACEAGTITPEEDCPTCGVSMLEVAQGMREVA